MHYWAKVSMAGCCMLLAAATSELRGQALPEAVGFLIVGQLPPDWPVSMGDTLQEVERGSVPSPVTAAAEAQSRKWGFATDCARYFHASRMFLVIASAGCQEGSVPRDDSGEGALLVTEEGALIGTPALARRLPAGAYWLFPAFRMVRRN